MTTSRPTKSLPPLDPPPIDPHHMAHYLAALRISGVPITQIARMSPVELRELIERLSRMSIPDAANHLRWSGQGDAWVAPYPALERHAFRES
jgi:hypothetical protein